ncbi:SUN domain-containing protein 1-like isoform X2 [Mytilus edulis]|uniref:SUN domain-containing protein 1-like isoform X2 n=1 Tax=Mytilus edulis TaxID=6550 RepID=UPI0039EE2221
MRSSKNGLSSKEVRTPPYSYNRNIHSKDTDFLQYDYFDFMKPTDYTYSRSPSYRRKVSSEHYQMPNMKRRQLKEAYEKMDDYSSDEEEELSYFTDEEIISTRTILKNGMLLRSGHKLKNKETFMEKMKLRRSMMSGNEYEPLNKTNTGTDVRSRNRRSLNITNEYSSYMGGSASNSRGTTMELNSRGTTMELNNRGTAMESNSRGGRGQELNSRGGGRGHTNHSTDITTTTRKTLIEDSLEKGMKEILSTKKKKKKAAVINHMYGLDSEELSESEWSLMNSASNSASTEDNSKYFLKGQSSSDSETSVTSTVVTTIIESVSYIASPIVTPVWNTVGRPASMVLWTTVSSILSVLHLVLWTSSGKYLYSLGKTVSNTSWNLVQYFIMHFILLDTWILKRRKTSACCLCLPLLLLLPLLFIASRSVLPLLSESSESSWLSIFATSSNRVIKITDSEGSSINMGHLEAEVKRIIVQLQDNRKVLSEVDVKAIVQSMLHHEVSQLRMNLSGEQNQHKATIMSQGNEFNRKLNLMNSQILDNITILQDRLSAEMKAIQSKGSTESSAAILNIQKLQQEISDLNSALKNVELSQEALQLQMKNCCKNDSFYAMTIQTHVNRILQQLMAGKMTGIDDQDSFTKWFHNHYISRNDLTDHMDKFGKEITKMVMLEVGKQQKTQVVLGEGGLSEQIVQRIVEAALLKYSADKLALPDFALESAGGSVVSTRCSHTYHRKTAQYSILGIPLWYVSNSPRTVIQPEIYPGSCWAFQGAQGYLVIELSTVINPTAFTLEHIPKSVTPDGKITSAPKDFHVLGLGRECDTEGTLLGNYTYNEDGKPLQFFPVKATKAVFKFIELRITSNHGNQMFTCLYRFRVHGIPAEQDKP